MDWITTQSGNAISKSARIPHPQFVLISGNSTIQHNVSLISDSLQLGKFVYISQNTTIDTKKCKIGSYVIIGDDCSLKCANIGNRVLIGANCRVDKSVVIHDCVVVRPNTFISSNMNVPPFSIVEQDCDKGHQHDSKCRLQVSLLDESFKKLIESWCKYCYINQEIPSDIP